MSKQAATYRPVAEVTAIYHQALSATMDRCTCTLNGGCYRWVPRGRAQCPPCAEGYCAHSAERSESAPQPTAAPSDYARVCAERDSLKACLAAVEVERDAARSQRTSATAQRDQARDHVEALRAERDALPDRLGKPTPPSFAAVLRERNQAWGERDRLRQLIRACQAQQVPWSDVVAAAGEGR